MGTYLALFLGLALLATVTFIGVGVHAAWKNNQEFWRLYVSCAGWLAHNLKKEWRK